MIFGSSLIIASLTTSLERWDFLLLSFACFRPRHVHGIHFWKVSCPSSREEIWRASVSLVFRDFSFDWNKHFVSQSLLKVFPAFVSLWTFLILLASFKICSLGCFVFASPISRIHFRTWQCTGNMLVGDYAVLRTGSHYGKLWLLTGWRYQLIDLLCYSWDHMVSHLFNTSAQL